MKKKKKKKKKKSSKSNQKKWIPINQNNNLTKNKPIKSLKIHSKIVTTKTKSLVMKLQLKDCHMTPLKMT